MGHDASGHSKNTLQVKVAINDPPDMITPEMLGQVTFLAAPQPADTVKTKQQPLRSAGPAIARRRPEGSASIWVADFERRRPRQTIQLGRAGTSNSSRSLEASIRRTS